MNLGLFVGVELLLIDRYNDFENNQLVSSGDLYYFTNGSYVLGKHLTNHNTIHLL